MKCDCRYIQSRILIILTHVLADRRRLGQGMLDNRLGDFISIELERNLVSGLIDIYGESSCTPVYLALLWMLMSHHISYWCA